MQKLILAAAVLLGAGATYVFVTKQSVGNQLRAAIADAAQGEITTTLDGCNLRMEAQSAPNDVAIALMRVTIQADLRNYSSNSASVRQGKGRTQLTISRSSGHPRMLTQVEKVIAAGGPLSQELAGDATGLAALITGNKPMPEFRVSAKMNFEKSDENTFEAGDVTAHEDAPAFYDFAQAVQDLPTPASYQVATMYGPGTPGRDTFLSGRITPLPPLTFITKTSQQAQNVLSALHRYKRIKGCN